MRSGSGKVDSLPAAVPQGEVVVVGSGALWTAVQPLELTDLGGGAPIRLVELDGHLALEMYNYTGPAKTFWEMAKPGSFYQGQPRCGFYAELAERTDYASGATLTCDKGPIWLCACPGGKRYVAAYSGIEKTSLRLEVPGDVVGLAEMGTGSVVWDEGRVKIEAIVP